MTTRTLIVPAKVESLGAITRFVRDGAQEADLHQPRLDELDLLVEEIFMNIARHAYPENTDGVVSVMYQSSAPGELAVEFGDQGTVFNPLEARPPDLALSLDQRTAGGLGVFLVKQFAQSLSYRREHGWNRLTLGIARQP